jgi:hypothetical protein
MTIEKNLYDIIKFLYLMKINDDIDVFVNSIYRHTTTLNDITNTLDFLYHNNYKIPEYIINKSKEISKKLTLYLNKKKTTLLK